MSLATKLEDMSLPALPSPWTQEAGAELSKKVMLKDLSILVGSIMQELSLVKKHMKVASIKFDMQGVSETFNHGLLTVCACTLSTIVHSNTLSTAQKQTLPAQELMKTNDKLKTLVGNMTQTMQHVTEHNLELPAELQVLVGDACKTFCVQDAANHDAPQPLPEASAKRERTTADDGIGTQTPGA